MFNAQKPAAAAPLPRTLSAVSAPTEASAPAGGGASVRLSRPIATHNGDIAEITLREPTFADYIEIGDVDIASGTGVDEVTGQVAGFEVRTNYRALEAWASRLSGLDRVVLGQLTAADAGKLMRAVKMAVAPFTRGNSSTEPTS